MGRKSRKKREQRLARERQESSTSSAVVPSGRQSQLRPDHVEGATASAGVRRSANVGDRRSHGEDPMNRFLNPFSSMFRPTPRRYHIPGLFGGLLDRSSVPQGEPQPHLMLVREVRIMETHDEDELLALVTTRLVLCE